MIKIEKNTTVYVLSLAYYKTGGLELLHQLVYELNNQGIRADIVYYNLKKSNNINPAFEKYVKSYKRKKDIVDRENNVLIVPETKVDFLEKYKYIQKCIWWLSVDNYLPNVSLKNHIDRFGVLRTIKHILLYHDKFRNWNLNEIANFHLVQSNYAECYLKGLGVKNIDKLSDYINEEYFRDTNSEIKRDIVLYNPAKGFEFTKKIIEKCPDINWIALQGMTNREIHAILAQGKVYIDFGNHPGKDRFPREAAILGCCVITSLDGAAGNKIDVPIPMEFKIKRGEENIDIICNKIRYCLKHYQEEILKFDKYREMIRQEKNIFVEDIKTIFGENI